MSSSKGPSTINEAENKAFPQRDSQGYNSEREPTKQHERCMKWLEKAVNATSKGSSYVKVMFDAMKDLGCEVKVSKHVVCEPCGGNVMGGYDPRNKQVILCENTIYSQGSMNDVLTHELIHAYDDCRAEVDWDNIHHLACSEVRAASLSGDCFFWKETFARLKFGWKGHHQACVKERATKSILCVRDVTEEEAKIAVESVFPSCFKDILPFERIPP